MNKRLLFVLLHIFVILTLIGLIFGISFGIAYSNTVYINNHIQTTCTSVGSQQQLYACCNTVCNNTLPSCSTLFAQNITGKCCNNATCPDDNICYVICNNCTKVNVTFSYISYSTNVIYDCNNNQTCVTLYSNTYNTPCWYDKTNTANVTFNQPVRIGWYIYYVIGMLCFLLVVYVLVISILIKKYNSCI